MQENLLFSAPVFTQEEKDSLEHSVSRCAARFKFVSKQQTDFEEEILPLPVCARAPLLALLFIDSDVEQREERLRLLLILYRIAVRIYERHILPDSYSVNGGYERFAGEDTEKIFDVLTDSVFEECDPEVSTIPEWKSPAIREILDALRLKIPFALHCHQLRYFCVLIMRILACYAADIKTFAEITRKEQLTPQKGFDEQTYKYRWRRFKLLKLANALIPILPSEDEYEKFFGSYSLR